MQDARLRAALALIAAVVIVGSGFALYRARQAAPPAVVISPAPAAPSSAPVVSQPPAPAGAAPKPAHARIYVHVAGAVRRPWLYALPAGSRVMQAVLAAGGPTSRADVDAVNLAEPVHDGEKVYVPAKSALPAVAPQPAPPGNDIGHATVVPASKTALQNPSDLPMPAVIEPPTAAGPADAAPRKHRSSPRGDKLTSPDQGQININAANVTDLERLPDVGPAMAARIVAYREQAHSFQSIDELQEVGGIGPKKFAKIAPFVTVN